MRTTPAALAREFTRWAAGRVVLEVGTHSPWVSRLFTRLGQEVLLANARQHRLICASERKSDRVDAETLARLGRLDPALLKPIRHRGGAAQVDLAQLRARDCLVRARTQLINPARGAVKAVGGRLAASSAPAFVGQVTRTCPRCSRTRWPRCYGSLPASPTRSARWSSGCAQPPGPGDCGRS